MSGTLPQLRFVILGITSEHHLTVTRDACSVAATNATVPFEIIVVLREDDPQAEKMKKLGAEVIEIEPYATLTPGGNRNRGAEEAQCEWLCFVDGDVELADDFVAHGIAFLKNHVSFAGYGGRLDERHWKAGKIVGGAGDLYRVGLGGEVDVVGAAWLCRGSAFHEVGGFDAALPSEEDFELCARLRQAGWKIWAASERSGWHDCAPRPSLAELGRRWKSGLFAGQGLALRRAWGTPVFAQLLKRDRLYVVSLGFLALGLVSLGAALAGSALALAIWCALALLAWFAMSIRKRSLRLGVMSLLTWTVQGLALLRAFLFGPWGEMYTAARPAAGRGRRGT